MIPTAVFLETLAKSADVQVTVIDIPHTYAGIVDDMCINCTQKFTTHAHLNITNKCSLYLRNITWKVLNEPGCSEIFGRMV